MAGTKSSGKSKAQQFFISVITVLLIAAICYTTSELIGYKTVALILLATVSVLAMFLSIWPVLAAAVLSALIWNFFFIPPHFTFHINNTEDTLMFLMYFLIALVNAVLTNKIRTTEKQTQQKEGEENTLKLYNTLLNSLSHELKTPIATISIASEMLKDNSISSSEENRSKYAGIIFEENKRLYNHVEQVLQLARLEKGELQLNLEDRDIHQIITSTSNHFQLILQELDGKIELNLNAIHSIFKVDEMHFTNVINNLIDNAVKYNDKTPLIKINTLNVPIGIQIEVIDNGVGLSKEDQHKIFDKFYRVTKGNVHDNKGFGLGLSYVKSIIEKHNGEIKVESKIKEGSKFTILLPIENKN